MYEPMNMHDHSTKRHRPVGRKPHIATQWKILCFS